MDYEKKYKEMKARVLEIGQGYVKGVDFSKPRQIAEYICPELGESEDERIRKMIIYQMERWHEAALENNAVQDIKDSADAITWLEKQGEKEKFIEKELGCIRGYREEALRRLQELEKQDKNHADMVEPMFHEGDWVISRLTKNEPRQIAEITEEGYKTTYGGWIGFSFEKDMRLWTIQDAKDGDVLTDGSCIFIIKKLNQDSIAEIYCCLFDDGDFEVSSSLMFAETSTYPATKEQRDILERSMTDAGYRWNKEKLKLEKI